MKAGSLRLIFAALLTLGGVVVWVFCFGYSFTAFLLFAAAAVLLLYDGLLRLKKRHPRTGKGLLIALTAILAAGAILAGTTEGFILSASSSDTAPESEYLLVLGAGVNGTKPSKSLRERLNAAIEYLQQYPRTICVVSGGQGAREEISEAQCMTEYLTAHGIAPERIWQETKATSTMENIEFSLAMIGEKTGVRPQTLTILTSEYHLFRAKRYAKACGVTAKGLAAHTQNPLIRINYYLREIPAVWKQLIFES